MRFRRHQDRARVATRALVLLFALTVLLTVLGVNLALALAWRLQFGGLAPYPTWFFETNTAVTLGFVLGGAWLESLQLRDGGAHVARLVGGREIVTPQGPFERRLRNIADELAIASGLKAPRLFLLEREDAINSLAAGWEQQDSVVIVTRGALDRLTRDELQGVVAHEFAHILNGDTRLNMRLIGMVFGLQMVFNFGRALMAPDDRRGRRGPALPIGLALVAVGSIGWLAGRLLKAGVSRQREYLADASAVQFTRLPSGLGNALRKVAGQLGRGQRLSHVNAEVVSPLLLSSDTLERSGWLATHPPIAQRLRRIFGHEMAALPDDVLAQPQPQAGARDLPPLDFASSGELAAPPAGIDGAAAGVLSGFSDLTTPERLRVAVLACLMPAQGGGASEQAAWRQAVGASAESLRVLQTVRALPPRQRQPWFERVLGQAAALPATERGALVREAIAVVQADGHLTLHEVLLARVLKHQLSARRPAAQRPLALSQLTGPVTAVTRALAPLWPPASATAWQQQVLGGLGLPAPTAAAAPSLRELSAALDQLAALGRMHRPALAKQWSEALPDSGLPAALADALRCLCLLIDTPLPPRLAAMFDPLPPLAEAAFERKECFEPAPRCGIASPLHSPGAIP